MWIIIVISVIIIALIIFVIIESSGFRTVSYDIYSNKLGNKNLKIAFLADLHNKDFGNNNEALVKAIEEYDPDIICFAGDMVTSGWDFNFDFSGTLKFIEKLASKYPIYYSPGNHEERFDRMRDRFPHQYDELICALNKMGINYLDNKAVSLEGIPVKIYGLNLPFMYFEKFRDRQLDDDTLNNLLGSVDNECFSILLAHDPRHFKNYVKWGAGLVLSGHVHGGIVSLPGLGGVVAPGVKLFPKYDAGLFEEDNSKMILTRGIGSHCIPIRVWNKAEIVFIDLKGEQNESQC